ncbi:MAG: oligopeptide transporter, OPT family [Prevotella sp.]|nr:oligopeptide transporter, OPT family [Prevotella sp.]
MSKEKTNIELPENAFRELKEGEEYSPIMPAVSKPREVTVWSVVWGLLMAVLFSAAAAYLGLRVGQVFEAAIPIAIIAVGLSSATKRRNALGENVIIQSIGACSGVVVAGAIFTLPALYIIQAKYPDVTVNFMQVFLSSLLGGVLGILFLIPFRKFFVKEQHGKYPFPEATATTQVLVSGEKGGEQAKPLLIAGIVGGVYDFLVATFGTWAEAFSTRAFAWGTFVADKAKLVFSINTSAAVLGLGYIVGLKYAAIICAGSAIVWFILVPLMPLMGDQVLCVLNPTFDLASVGSVSAMSPEEIFKTFGRHIGIGGIAMAGLIGIIKQWSIIKGAVSLAGRELKGSATQTGTTERTQRDLPMKIVVIGVIAAIVATFIFFYAGVVEFNLFYAIVGILVIGIISFLFTTVAANAIAIVGTNPVSGMTLMTLILASLIMVAIGLKGSAGMVTALIMGGVVCTALSTAGGFITDLKIGYWLGTTPQKQETWKFLGILVSAVTVGGVMILLNKTYGFVGDNALVAPQANAMAAVIEPMMSGTGAPWLLYGAGAVIALILNWLGIPALAFALGMFIPMDLNAPLLVGGAINWFITTRTKDAQINAARGEKGTLIASGFIAGGALMGVVSALLRFFDFNPANEAWLANPLSQLLSIAAYLLLICYFITSTRKK